MDDTAAVLALPEAEAPGASAMTTKVNVDDAPEHARSSASAWWKITEQAPGYQEMCEQYERDRETLAGGSEQDRKDPEKTQHFSVYRNAAQTVAFLLASPPESKLTARRQAKGLNRGSVGANEELAAFADTCETALEKLQEEAGWTGTRETWCWRGITFQASFLRVTWQEKYTQDPLTTGRNPDSQDNIQRMRYLLEMLDSGDIDADSAEAHEPEILSSSVGVGEIAQWRGVCIESIGLARVRVAGNVQSPDQFYHANWISIDHWKTVAEVLARNPQLKREDLRGANGYLLNGTLYQPINSDQDRSANPRPVQEVALKDSDYLRVREIQVRTDQKVIELCEGLPVALREYVREDAPGQFYDLVMWVANFNEGTWYGKSFAQLQDKVQRRIDRKASDEDRDRFKSRPRWAVDSAVPDAAGIAKKVDESAPGDVIPFPISAEKAADAFFPLWSNGSFRSEDYDRSEDYRIGESLASIPRQSTGTTGDAKFATEVEVAAAGQNAAATKLQRTWAEAMARSDRIMVELLIHHADAPLIQLLAGPYAFWPQDVQRRRDLLRGLTPTVSITYQGLLDRQRAQESISRLVELAKSQGRTLPWEPLIRLWAKAARLEQSIDELVTPDAVQAIAVAAQALEDPNQQIPHDALAALAAMGQEAQQRLLQQMAAMPATGAPQPQPTPTGAP